MMLIGLPNTMISDLDGRVRPGGGACQAGEVRQLQSELRAAIAQAQRSGGGGGGAKVHPSDRPAEGGGGCVLA